MKGTVHLRKNKNSFLAQVEHMAVQNGRKLYQKRNLHPHRTNFIFYSRQFVIYLIGNRDQVFLSS